MGYKEIYKTFVQTRRAIAIYLVGEGTLLFYLINGRYRYQFSQISIF